MNMWNIYNIYFTPLNRLQLVLASLASPTRVINEFHGTLIQEQKRHTNRFHVSSDLIVIPFRQSDHRSKRVLNFKVTSGET